MNITPIFENETIWNNMFTSPYIYSADFANIRDDFRLAPAMPDTPFTHNEARRSAQMYSCALLLEVEDESLLLNWRRIKDIATIKDLLISILLFN